MKTKGKTPRQVLKPKRSTTVTPKPAPRSANINWSIHRIRKSPAELVGWVQAKDAESAVKRYIAERLVTDPFEQKRLFAMRNG